MLNYILTFLLFSRPYFASAQSRRDYRSSAHTSSDYADRPQSKPMSDVQHCKLMMTLITQCPLELGLWTQIELKEK